MIIILYYLLVFQGEAIDWIVLDDFGGIGVSIEECLDIKYMLELNEPDVWFKCEAYRDA